MPVPGIGVERDSHMVALYGLHQEKGILQEAAGISHLGTIAIHRLLRPKIVETISQSFTIAQSVQLNIQLRKITT